jgi:hypothetical protein
MIVWRKCPKDGFTLRILVDRRDVNELRNEYRWPVDNNRRIGEVLVPSAFSPAKTWSSR